MRWIPSAERSARSRSIPGRVPPGVEASETSPSRCESLLALGGWLRRDAGANIWLAEQLLRIRDREGRLQPLVANAAQRLFEQRCGPQNIVLKARQMGMTTWIAARFFLRTITTPGSVCLQVAHTREAAETLFRTVHRLWEQLPPALRNGPLRLRRSNRGQIVFAALDSEFRIASAAEPNAGRGLRVNLLHLSEVSRWPGNAAETLAGLRAALAPGGELVMESTPNGAYGAFYDEWQRAREPDGSTRYHSILVGSISNSMGSDDSVYKGPKDRCGLVRHFLPWWLEPSYRGVPVSPAAMSAEELTLVGRWGLTPAQIGFRRGLDRRFGPLRAQEFAEEADSCFRASGSCCFDLATLEERLRETPAPREQRLGGALLLWLPPAPGRRYIVAADPAGGGSEGDFAAIEVIDADTGLQCAELQARLRPEVLAREAATLAREYNGALLAVERNNHGSAVLAFLETVERYGNLYTERGEPGWLTTPATRPEALARLNVLLRDTPERFMSRRLLLECRSFITTGNRRQEAAPGAHDDLVLAMAIAQAVRASELAG